jgi:hypothetical protein
MGFATANRATDAHLLALITMLIFHSTHAKLNIVAIESPPFVCTEDLPCAPAMERTPEIGQGTPGCLYEGVKTQSGVCLHGYLIDLLKALTAPKAGNFSYNLWLTTLSVVGGYDNLVREVFGPGSILSNPLCGNSSCDIALGDITVNWNRRRIENSRFATPYMTTGLQILGRTKVPARSAVNFDFMSPFTTRLWVLILFSLIFFTFAIAFVEAPVFRSKFVYCRPESSEISWQEDSVSRYKNLSLLIFFVYYLAFLSEL